MSRRRIGGRRLIYAKVHVWKTDLKEMGGELDIIINELIYVVGVSLVVLVVHIA